MHRYISEGVYDFSGLRELDRNSASEFLDIRIEAIGPDFLIATMPVDERTRQPFGLLHGGASILLAETLGSIASLQLVSDEPGAYAVGIDVGGSHLRAVRGGRVTGVCRPLRIGRNVHFWQIDVSGEDGRLCCSARLTISIVRRDAEPGT